MKHKTFLFFITMIMVTAISGCGKQQLNTNTPTVQQQTQQEQNSTTSSENIPQNSDVDNPVTGDGLFEISKLNGSVTEFSATDCKITPTYSDGNTAYEAAPGYEDQSDYVTVSYDENCIFQIANVNIQTGSVAYESASVNDVKKQTRLIVCGEYDDDNVLHAARVYIYRGA